MIDVGLVLNQAIKNIAKVIIESGDANLGELSREVWTNDYQHTTSHLYTELFYRDQKTDHCC